MNIRMDIEGGQETLNWLARAGERARPEARRLVREASFALMRRVKNEMPVLTGRARASWGVWTAGDLAAPNPDADKADAVWDVSDGGLTITQGSNVPYIAALNEGHSKQAPAGFIDKAVEAAQRALIGAIDAMLRRLF